MTKVLRFPDFCFHIFQMKNPAMTHNEQLSIPHDSKSIETDPAITNGIITNSYRGRHLLELMREVPKQAEIR